jgi:hypothetical protein
MTKDARKKQGHEPPLLMDLGALARGLGRECKPGSAEFSGECVTGGGAGTNCHSGGSPGSGKCEMGGGGS